MGTTINIMFQRRIKLPDGTSSKEKVVDASQMLKEPDDESSPNPQVRQFESLVTSLLRTQGAFLNVTNAIPYSTCFARRSLRPTLAGRRISFSRSRLRTSKFLTKTAL